MLDAGGKIALPITPPPLRNHGNHIISLSRFGKWLADARRGGRASMCSRASPASRCCSTASASSACGPAIAASDATGSAEGTFEPGVDIHAKVTIFCDGVRGNLTKQLLARLPLAEGREPEQYAIGIKELWEVPADRSRRAR